VLAFWRAGRKRLETGDWRLDEARAAFEEVHADVEEPFVVLRDGKTASQPAPPLPAPVRGPGGDRRRGSPGGNRGGGARAAILLEALGFAESVLGLAEAAPGEEGGGVAGSALAQALEEIAGLIGEGDGAGGGGQGAFLPVPGVLQLAQGDQQFAEVAGFTGGAFRIFLRDVQSDGSPHRRDGIGEAAEGAQPEARRVEEEGLERRTQERAGNRKGSSKKLATAARSWPKRPSLWAANCSLPRVTRGL